MNFFNNLQKVCRKHTMLLSLIQLLFVFFVQGLTAKSNSSFAGVGGGECTPPGATASVSGIISCQTTHVTLSGNSPTTGTTYKWVGPGDYYTTLQNPTVDLPGGYVLIVTDTMSGCISTAIVYVEQRFEPIPDAMASVSGMITCANPSVTLTGTSSSPNVTYSWVGPSGFLSTDPTLQTSKAGNYYLTVTAPNNMCAGYSSVVVTIDTVAPMIESSVSNVLTCAQPSATLAGSSTTIGVSYQWNGPQSFTSTVSNTVVTEPGVYMLTISNPVNGCSVGNSVVVLQDKVIPGGVIATASGIITCVSPTVALHGASTTAAVTYNWSGPAGFLSNVQSPIATIPGTYTLTVTSAVNGCSTTASLEVDQDAAFPANVTAVSLDTLGCSIVIGRLVASSSTPDVVDFTWSFIDDPSFEQNGPEAYAWIPGMWKLRATNLENGCIVEKTVNVLYDDTPPTCSLTPATGNTVLHNSVNTISTMAKSTYTYQWASSSWSMISGQGTNSVTYLAGNTGTSSIISVHIEDHRGCSSDCSATLTAVATKSATVESLQGAALESNEVALNAYPVPSNGKVSVEFSSPVNTSATLEVYNEQGALVTKLFENTAEANQAYKILLNENGDLPEGLYLCTLKTKTETKTKKVLIRP